MIWWGENWKVILKEKLHFTQSKQKFFPFSFLEILHVQVVNLEIIVMLLHF